LGFFPNLAFSDVEICRKTRKHLRGYERGGPKTSIGPTPYTWDVNKRLKDVIDSHAGTFTYSYDGVGNEAGLAYPNGIAKTTTYDTRERLSTIGYKLGATTVASYAYPVDMTGRRTQVVENTGRTVHYGHDSLYRLTSEAVSNAPNAINGAVSYTYDSVGNRQRRDGTLGPVSNQVSTFNGNDQLNCEQYDLNGNVIQNCEGDRFSWDFENRLVAKNNGQTSLSYDGDGSRVRKTVGAMSTSYLVDDRNPSGLRQVLEEAVTSQALVVFTFGRSVLAENAGTPEFLCADGVRNVRLVLSSTTAALSLDYDAFGRQLGPATTDVRHQYRGEEFEAALGLTYLRSRWLNSETGRFNSQDSVLGVRAAPRSLALYSYAENDPTNRSDPTGHESSLGEMSVAVGVVGILSMAIYDQVSRRATDVISDDCPGGRWVAGNLVGEMFAGAGPAGGGEVTFIGPMWCASKPTLSVRVSSVCGMGFIEAYPHAAAEIGGAAYYCFGYEHTKELEGWSRGAFLEGSVGEGVGMTATAFADFPSEHGCVGILFTAGGMASVGVAGGVGAFECRTTIQRR
jgi:RHS repeat-associated protein